MVLPLLLPIVRPLPVHPLRLASLAASPYAGAKGTEIPRYARNDSDVRAPFVLADISPVNGGNLRVVQSL